MMSHPKQTNFQLLYKLQIHVYICNDQYAGARGRQQPCTPAGRYLMVASYAFTCSLYLRLQMLLLSGDRCQTLTELYEDIEHRVIAPASVRFDIAEIVMYALLTSVLESLTSVAGSSSCYPYLIR